jgi:hypothetical protein
MASTGATGGDLATSRPGVGRAVRRLTSETKQAFKTTEFWAMVGLIAAILISAALISGGGNGTDEFFARQAWLYVAILGAGYFISRGLAKSGSREPYTDDPSDRGDRDNRGDRGGVVYDIASPGQSAAVDRHGLLSGPAPRRSQSSKEGLGR